MNHIKLEDIFQRFPLVCKQICNELDDESLINLKEASRNNDEFLEEERFFWVRRIGAFHGLMGDLQEVWKTIVLRTPVEIVKELVLTVQLFCQLMKRYYENETLSAFNFVQRLQRHYHPYFVCRKSNNENLCNHIIQRTGIERPRYEEMVRIIDAKISFAYIPNHTAIIIDYKN